MDYIFYDIESLPTHFCISYAINRGEAKTIRSAKEFLQIASGKQVVGFNNHNYDDYVILFAIGKTPKQIHQFSDQLINVYGANGEFPPFERLENTLDASQDLKDGKFKMSLKKAEQRLDLQVDSFELGFENLNRNLTPEEIDRLEEYNRHDVLATRSVFGARYPSYFRSRFWIMSELDTPDEWDRVRGVGSLISKLLGDQPPRLNEVTTLYDVPTNFPSDFLINKDEWTLQTKDVKMVYGTGGVHSSIGKYSGKAIGLDVSSMYPTIIDNLGLLGEKYHNMKIRRINAKHSGDKDTSDSLKLSLNRTNGNFLSKFSKLYNPYAYSSVIKTGQIIIYRLHQMLENHGYTILQDNTDGIIIAGDEYDDQLTKDFEEEYNLELERTDFDNFVQKDVNNYVALKSDGKIKGKGSYFKGLDGFTLDHAPKSYYVANELTKRLLGIERIDGYKVEDFVISYAVTSKFHIELNGSTIGRVINCVASYNGYGITKVRNEDSTHIRLPDQPEQVLDLKEATMDDIDLDYYNKLVDSAYKKFTK